MALYEPSRKKRMEVARLSFKDSPNLYKDIPTLDDARWETNPAPFKIPNSFIPVWAKTEDSKIYPAVFFKSEPFFYVYDLLSTVAIDNVTHIIKISEE